MKKLLAHPAVFVALYILFMIPTYILPYFGSNSSLLNAAAVGSGMMNPAFAAHFLVMIALVVLTWLRGSVIDKRWLLVFPVLAMCFDLLPAINIIPLVPTIMHLLAIILGVITSNQVAANRAV